jgi:uncharacterized protein YbbC (DUF1343 family)
MLCGIDQLFSGQLAVLRRRVRSSRIAVLTHAAAVDRRGRHALDVLEELGASCVVVLTPEHGFDADAQAEEAVAAPAAPPNEVGAAGDEGDQPGDLNGNAIPLAGTSPWAARVVSLYGESKDSLQPTAEQLDGSELLVIDLCDVGSRYYTFVWTALLAARKAAELGIHTLVLDRPNPVSGDPSTLEGAPQQTEFLSFVGLEPLPIRHALTIGEILTLFVERDGRALGPDGALSVVSTRGWERHRTASAWGRPFVMPSPNMPTVETAMVYPGGCLIEGTNLSEGRGTTAPFQLIGAPYLDGRVLARDLSQAGTPGAQVRPVTFRPTFEKHAGQRCNGVMVHVTDAALFRPVATYLRLIALARAQAPESFRFRTEPYEFETQIPAFDLLTGSSAAREALERNASPEEIVDLVAPVAPEWREQVLEAEARVDRARA